MLGKKSESQLIEESKLDINNYSDNELRVYVKRDLQEAILHQRDVENGLHAGGVRTAQGQTQIKQNWVIIRQNELLLRQNKRIIQLLESMASAQGVAVPSVCPSCNNTIANGTAFCSQCGCKLAD